METLGKDISFTENLGGSQQRFFRALDKKPLAKILFTNLKFSKRFLLKTALGKTFTKGLWTFAIRPSIRLVVKPATHIFSPCHANFAEPATRRHLNGQSHGAAYGSLVSNFFRICTALATGECRDRSCTSRCRAYWFWLRSSGWHRYKAVLVASMSEGVLVGAKDDTHEQRQ